MRLTFAAKIVSIKGLTADTFSDKSLLFFPQLSEKLFLAQKCLFVGGNMRITA